MSPVTYIQPEEGVVALGLTIALRYETESHHAVLIPLSTLFITINTISDKEQIFPIHIPTFK